MKKIKFENLPSQNTPVNATNVNKLQDNIEEVFNGEEAMGSIVVEDVLSKNLFSGFIEGVYNQTTGMYESDGTGITTNKMKVEQGTQYFLSGTASGTTIRVHYWNDNKYVGNEVLNAPVVIIPQGNIMAFQTSPSASYTDIQLEKGIEPTEYTPFKKFSYNEFESMGKVVVDNILCKNVFNINGNRSDSVCTANVFDNNLIITCIGAWAQTKFYNVKVKKGKRYILSYNSTNSSGNSIRAVIFKADGTTVFVAEDMYTDTSASKSFTFIPVEDEIVIGFTANGTSTSNTNVVTFNNIQLELGDKATPYTPYRDFISASIKNDQNLKLTQSNIISITPLVGSNYEAYGNCYYYKVGTRVHVHLGLSDLTPNDANVVFKLPEGFRPLTLVTAVGVGQGLDENVSIQLSLYGDITVYTKSIYALFDFEFDAFY